MNKEGCTREYVDIFPEYCPEKWRWSLKNTSEQSELYKKTRARQSGTNGEDRDLKPDFYSIERDAMQFGLEEVEWTDFFGLVWEGRKGAIRMVGAADHKGSLYYICHAEDSGEIEYFVSNLYDAYDHQPTKAIYTRVDWYGMQRWIDTKNVVDIRCSYTINDRLSEEIQIDLIYEDGEEISVYNDFRSLLMGMKEQGKSELVEKVLLSVKDHFTKLCDPAKEEVRDFYPCMASEEIILSKGKGEKWYDNL